MTQPSSDPIVPSRAQLAANLGLPYVPAQAGASFFNANGDPKLTRRAQTDDDRTPENTEVQDPVASYELEVLRERRRLEVRDEARRRHNAGSFTPPATQPLNLRDLAMVPRNDKPWLIAGLHRSGYRTTIIAARKAGKSTLTVNLAKSLADGTPLLGEHEVTQLDGNFLWCDLEQGIDTSREMLEAVSVDHPEKIVYWDLGGQGFNIMNDDLASWFIGELKRLEIQAFCFDTFRQAFRGEDANSDAGIMAFQRRIDQIRAESGVTDFFLSVHAGWEAEKDDSQDIRSRGSSGLEDWPDALWTLGKKDKTRFFKAKHVRGISDNDLGDERALAYDHATRTMTYDGARAGMTRANTKQHQLEEDIFEEISNNPGATGNQLGFDGSSSKPRKAARDALKRQGKIVLVEGPRGAHLHYVAGTQPFGSTLIP